MLLRSGAIGYKKNPMLDPTRLPPALWAEIVRRIVALLPVERVVLFGSQAAGTANSNSDVDLLVVAPFAGRRLDTAVAVRKALRGLGIAKDIVVLKPEEYEQQKDIPGSAAWPAAHEGRVLHAV